MSQINLSDLTFSYPGSYDNVFEHVSLRLDTDWRLGLVGRNGRGKTTLLRLLQGQYSFQGSISSAVRFDYFPFPVSGPEKAVLEVLEDLNPTVEEWRILKELAVLDVDPRILYRPFCTLSNGEQTKVLLSALFLKPDSFHLIDEPTNHLDLEGRQVVSTYLRKKKGFILVSHDRAFLDGCVDHILSINKLDLELQQGNFSSWWENKERRDNWERAENDRLRRDIRRLDESVRRTAGWSDQVEATKYGTKNSGLRPDRGFIGHKAAKMMKRSKATAGRRQAAVEEKRDLLKNIELTEPLKLHPLTPNKRLLVEAQEVAVDYGCGLVCSPTSFTVERGERVALVGGNGAGKSSLLNLVLGEAVPHTGALTLASGLIVSAVPQNPSFLTGDLSSFAEASGLDEPLFKAILRKLDFSRVQFEKDMAEFSAGQKKKVLLARSLCQEAHLYVWDEPLNYVDIFSRMQIEALLEAYRPTILFVEHDKDFLDKIATRQVVLSRPLIS